MVEVAAGGDTHIRSVRSRWRFVSLPAGRSHDGEWRKPLEMSTGGSNSAAYADLSLRFKFGRDRLSCCAGKSHETGKNVLAPADLGTQSAHCRGRDHRARAGD